MKPQDLEDRLIDFAVAIVDVVEALPHSKAGSHIAGQSIRSGRRRYHLPRPVYNEAIKRAAGAAGIEKRVTSHALRH